MTTVTELFAGAGGLSLGAVRAGMTIVEAHELDRAACDVYPAVTGCDHIHQTDLTKYDYSKLPDSEWIVGGPPCVEFSIAVRRRGKDGARNLWPQTIKIIEKKRPAFFLFENVKNLTKGVNKPYFEDILTQLRTFGYRVDWRVLDAADYGVPQNRERVFITGRLDGQAWNWPIQTHHKNAGWGVNRWVSWFEALTGWLTTSPEPCLLPEWILKIYRYSSMFDGLPNDGFFPSENLRKQKNHREKYEPSTTITTGTHHLVRVVVDTQPFKLDENGRCLLQTLPVNVGLTKTQIGNAVPSLLAQRLFESATSGANGAGS